jgi:cob(I)alamin adenosyltransferase
VTKIEDVHLARLERELDAFNADLPGLKEFILPGGSLAAADAHIARTACRAAERVVVALGKAEPGGDGARKYLNRLSDLLFVLARVLNRAAGRPDVLWQQGKNRG